MSAYTDPTLRPAGGAEAVEAVEAVVLRVEDRPSRERAPLPGSRALGDLLRLARRITGRARQPLALAAPLARAVTTSRPVATLRRGGRDVSPEQAAAADDVTRLVVLLAPPGRSEQVWEAGRETTGATYAERLELLLGWTPLHMRVSDGDPVAAAVAVSSLLQRYVDALAAPPIRIVLVGAGTGGLLARNALGVATAGAPAWTSLVSDVIALGTPPYAVTSAPISRGVGRAIDEQLAGIAVLPEELVALPPAEGVDYVVVTDPLTAQPNPVSRLLGELLWWRHKTPLRRRKVRDLFPRADRFELATDRTPLSNHPDVHDALLRWLA